MVMKTLVQSERENPCFDLIST